MPSLGLHRLPADILSEIFQLLRLSDVAKLRQACRSLQNTIANDKRLWIYIINEYVYGRGARLPLQIEGTALQDLDTSALEYWARSSLILDQTYNGSGANTHSIIYELHYVTWVKLIRGRWCLVASSHYQQSQLIVYDALGGLSPNKGAVFYLDGPVMDGVIEDTSSAINLALSIGTKNPYIKILTLCTSSESSPIQLLECATIVLAYETRFLQGCLLGFAVSDGDDTVPYVMNWLSGKKWALGSPFQNEDTKNDKYPVQATCEAMTVWMDYIAVALMDRIEIYSKPLSDVGPKHISTLHLDFMPPVRSVSFSTHCYSPELCWLKGHGPTCTVLQFITSNCQNQVHLFRVSRQLDDNGRYRFILKKYMDTLRTYAIDDDGPYTITIGSSGSMICFVFFPQDITKLPTLRMARIRTPRELNDEERDVSALVKVILVPTVGFPLLHMSPCLDFDDGRGVALVGTSMGEICLFEFEGGGVHKRLAIDDRLPNKNGGDNLGSQNPVPMSPINLNLPSIYEWFYVEATMDKPLERDDFACMPEHVIKNCVSRWQFTYINFTPLLSKWSKGWSNDWVHFDKLQHWLTPVLLWKDDFTVCNKFPVISRLHDHFGIIGEPIPLLYNADNPSVVFRVGSRLFLLMYEYYGEGLDSAIEDITRIQIPIEQFLSGEVTDRDVYTLHTPLAVLYSNISTFQDSRWARYYSLLEFADNIGFHEMNGRHASSWSQEKWDVLHELWEEVLREGYSPIDRKPGDEEKYFSKLRLKVLKGFSEKLQIAQE